MLWYDKMRTRAQSAKSFVRKNFLIICINKMHRNKLTAKLWLIIFLWFFCGKFLVLWKIFVQHKHRSFEYFLEENIFDLIYVFTKWVLVCGLDGCLDLLYCDCLLVSWQEISNIYLVLQLCLSQFCGFQKESGKSIWIFQKTV